MVGNSGCAADRAASQEIDARIDALVEATVAALRATQPTMDATSDGLGRARQREGVRYVLSYAAEALHWCSPALFTDAAAWAQVALRQYGIGERDIETYLKPLDRVCHETLSADAASRASQILALGLAQLAQPAREPETYLPDDAPLVALARDYLAALLEHDRPKAVNLILKAAESGTPVRDVYLRVFQPVQMEVGRLWQLNRLSVAQEHYCTAATLLISSMIHVYAPKVPPAYRTLVAVAVSGERHEFGIRMVADFFELAGWDVAYLGADTPLEGLARLLDEVQADVLAISATMTPNLRAVAAIVEGVRSASLHKQPRIIVGGYPFTLVPDLWVRVGADAGARDAEEAVEVANRLLA
jgi:MerR family transcriptional regulator, light-induced transcriptional regulator